MLLFVMNTVLLRTLLLFLMNVYSVATNIGECAAFCYEFSVVTNIGGCAAFCYEYSVVTNIAAFS